jgi:hypothetical protein
MFWHILGFTPFQCIFICFTNLHILGWRNDSMVKSSGYSFFFFFWVFQDRVSLCSSGCPGTHFVDQAGLELRNLPASASWVLGLKACATMPAGYSSRRPGFGFSAFTWQLASICNSSPGESSTLSGLYICTWYTDVQTVPYTENNKQIYKVLLLLRFLLCGS